MLLPTDSDMKRMFPPEIVDQLEGLMKSALAKTKKGTIAHKRIEWFYTKAFSGFFEKTKAYWREAKKHTVGKLTKISSPPIINGKFDTKVWKNSKPMVLKSKYIDTVIKDKTEIYTGADAKNFYVTARLTLDPKIPAVAAAKGAQNPKVEQDDMFVIHLAVPGKNEYVELVINPAGAYSTKIDIIRTQGFFPEGKMTSWPGKDIQVVCAVDNNIWTIEVAIPWKSLPGLTKQPKELQAQFLRWLKSDKHLN